MVRISLLPPELKAERQARRRRRYFFLGSVAVLGVFATLYFVVAGATLYSRAELGRLEEHRAALETEKARYQQYARMQAEVKRLEKLVCQAMERPPDWEQVLTATGQYIPEGVWLTDFKAAWERKEKQKKKLQAKEKEKKDTQAPTGPIPGELTLRGLALSHALVAAWLKELEQVPGIEDIRCKFTAERQVERTPLIEFEVKATVHAGPGYRLVGATSRSPL